MTRPDRSSAGRTAPYPPLVLVVVGLVALGVITNQTLEWSLVAAGVAALYAGYRTYQARQ
ncbi:hypothetical protein [Halobacterium jilantaiense]|uniref:Uncharacterized protein n=1 Tax=Halobacterium jilantaiense TaxID=355548 RepID=A0A1I0QQE2_9EURY|nr:hypothetical protein [Halobacterium jilantaiense]SEW29678.1 hypothetical protein SAMN04487945_2849 [Halobacterium jilantaiense]